jgi:hypothetical protein
MLTAADIPFDVEPVIFTRQDGRYVFSVRDGTIDFIVDRLRRDRHELHGELEVRCCLKGVRTYDGALSVGSLNLSSPRARQERARLLTDRAKTNEVDWLGYLEEFTQRVLTSDRAGEPAIVLRDVVVPATTEDDFDINGLRLPKKHPTFLFGDGGGCKSMLALYGAGELEQRGERVGFFDAELDALSHRRRLGQLYPDQMPGVRYVRLERPLVYEVDRLRRIIDTDRLTYAVLDSAAFLTNGAPESAEAAGEYFRAVRQLGIGTLNIAHITKGENGDQKPFGSVFWHNGARSTWFVKATSSDTTSTTVGLFNRKANLGPISPAVGFRVTFTHDRIDVARINVADVDDLATGLPLSARLKAALRPGPMTVAQLADELEAKTDTVKKTLDRGKGRAFTCITATENGVHRWALLERRSA